MTSDLEHLQQALKKVMILKKAVDQDTAGGPAAPKTTGTGYNRELTSDLQNKYHSLGHSGALANPDAHSGHEVLQDVDGAFSQGTVLANHAHYQGGIRMKPSDDIFNEAASGWQGSNGTAHRELAVHDLAHNHFGLGDHFHHVGLVHHNDAIRSVHENLLNHVNLSSALTVHLNRRMQGKRGTEKFRGEGGTMEAKQRADEAFEKLKSHVVSPKNMLDAAHKSGKLHKLALFDYIIGNHDRHGQNVMTHQSGAKALQMIDHGLALPPARTPSGDHMPATFYLHKDQKAIDQHAPVSAWLSNIDQNAIVSDLARRGFHERVIDGVNYRFNKAREVLSQHRDLNDALKVLWQDNDPTRANQRVFQPAERPEAKVLPRNKALIGEKEETR